jgi:hypothetical protein
VTSIHLTNTEITAAAAGERSNRIDGHLEICSDCWQQVAGYREGLSVLRQDVCFSANRSALDWGKQSRSIMHRIAKTQRTQRHSSLQWAFASSALALVLVVLAFIGYRPQAPIYPAPKVEISDAALLQSDAALLQSVESRLNEEIPDALQPAGLLVNEMGGISAPDTAPNSHSRTRNTQ